MAERMRIGKKYKFGGVGDLRKIHDDLRTKFSEEELSRPVPLGSFCIKITSEPYLGITKK